MIEVLAFVVGWLAAQALARRDPVAKAMSIKGWQRLDQETWCFRGLEGDWYGNAECSAETPTVFLSTLVFVPHRAHTVAGMPRPEAPLTGQI